MKSKIALYIAISLLTSAAEAGSLSLGGNDFKSIIGGSPVESTDPIASSTVLIVGKEANGQQFICTGSILDTNIILTAAHCIGENGDAKLVVAFRTSVQSDGPVVPVIKRIRPSNFEEQARRSPKDWGDLALLKLASPIPAGYKPAKLYDSSLRDGDSITLAGYGMTTPISTSSDDGSGVLRKVQQFVLQANFAATEILVDIRNGRGACHGDSGGPGLIKKGNDYYVFGVASRMTENDRVANNGDSNDFSCSVDMVYTSVMAQKEWIQAAAARLR